METRPPWRKALYLRQPYEDNYVGESFLDSLVVNAHVQRYSYRALCRGAMCVVQQLCLLCALVGAWSRLRRRAWSHGAMLALDVLVLVIGFACELASGRWRELTCSAAVCSTLRFVAVAVPLWLLSFVLQWLTRCWSDDSIVALAAVLLLVHIVRYDYGGASGSAAPSGSAVAPNAALLAAAVLASALETPGQVITFVAFAMEVFVFFFQLSLRLRHRAPSVHAFALTPVLVVAAAGLLGTGRTVALVFVALGVVGFLGPALLMWAQRYKAQIQGPWDIAHVEPK